MALRDIVKGRTTLQHFCAFMDMLPSVKSPSYHECASDNMLASSTYLHQLYGIQPTKIIDVAVPAMEHGLNVVLQQLMVLLS